MKKLTGKASVATRGLQRPPSKLLTKELVVALASSDDLSTQAETATPADVTATPAAARSGLDLLVDASSEVDTKPKEADGGEVPSTITGITNGEIESEMGASASSLEYDTTYEETKKQQCKTFPQILHEILSTPDYQSIARWLPEGSSFFIADKERFSDEILPKYFRVALFHSFIRKLNRYGFRRAKSRFKGGAPSFTHSNFVRDKPWLCLKMHCKSKPSFHKVKKQDATSEAVNSSIAMPSQFPPSYLLPPAGGIVDINRGNFLPTYLPTTSTFHIANAAAAAAAAAAASTGSHTTAATTTVSNTIQERQYPPHPEKSIFRERQILMFQMRQRHLIQMQLQRLDEMSAHTVDNQIANSYVQRTMMEQQYKRDLMSRNSFFRDK
jgi:hypothetical protein